MDFYRRHQWHDDNNRAFLKAISGLSLNLFQPNAEKAPWHWQAVIDLGAETIVLNFWPHTLKGQRDGCRAVKGKTAIREMVLEALKDAERPVSDLSVIED